MCTRCKALGLYICMCAAQLPTVAAIITDVADIIHREPFAYHMHHQADGGETDVRMPSKPPLTFTSLLGAYNTVPYDTIPYNGTWLV